MILVEERFGSEAAEVRGFRFVVADKEVVAPAREVAEDKFGRDDACDKGAPVAPDSELNEVVALNDGKAALPKYPAFAPPTFCDEYAPACGDAKVWPACGE